MDKTLKWYAELDFRSGLSDITVTWLGGYCISPLLMEIAVQKQKKRKKSNTILQHLIYIFRIIKLSFA